MISHGGTADKIRPMNLEAERSVIGSILLDNEARDKIPFLKVTHFCNPTNAEIFAACDAILDRDGVVDSITLAEELDGKGRLEECGGVDYILKILETVAHATHVEHYARIVYEKCRRRVIQTRCEQMLEGVDSEKKVDDLLAAFDLSDIAGSGGPDLLNTVTVADVEPESVSWLWPGRIPIGKCTLFVGMPGVGKSFVSCDIAARVTTGRAWPDCHGQTHPTGDVLFLASEDGLADTIRPRLDECGADVNRVHYIQGVGRDGRESFELDKHLRFLDRHLDAHPEIVLMVLDPLDQFLGSSVDSHKSADIRRVLGPLGDIAQKHGIAIVSVAHFNKSQKGDALYRALGSVAIGAQARVAWGFVVDKDDDRILFLSLKNNLHRELDGLAYRIQDGLVQGYVEWDDDPITTSANDALADAGPERKTAVDEVAEWLESRLQDGPVPSNEITSESKDMGFSQASFRRAKDTLRVRSAKSTTSPYAWCMSLPDPALKNNEHVEQVEHLLPMQAQIEGEGVQGVQGVQGAQGAQGAQVPVDLEYT